MGSPVCWGNRWPLPHAMHALLIRFLGMEGAALARLLGQQYRWKDKQFRRSPVLQIFCPQIGSYKILHANLELQVLDSFLKIH